MCGRFNSSISVEEIKRIYYAVPDNMPEIAGNYNTAPTQSVPIIMSRKDGEREIKLARFGIPMTVGGKSFPLINLQSEKVANREDFKTRRCIIPAAGFYEWEKITPKDKQPHYFSPVDGLFSFAGVWKQSPGGLAFSIFTTQANDIVAPIHGRMPVILGHNAVGEWLTPSASPLSLMPLMQPYPSSLMQAWKVSKAVNSPKNADAACINSV